jgi:antigen 43
MKPQQKPINCNCLSVIKAYGIGLISLLGLSPMLSAQALSWAPNEDTSLNGSGIWSTSEVSWQSGSDPREAWVDGRNAVLGRQGSTTGSPLSPGGDYTITINGAITVNQIRQISGTGANLSQYTLTGGTINLSDGGGSAGFRVDTGTLTINSNVVYTGEDTQRLEGTIVLGGDNNVTTWHLRGTTTLNSANAMGGNGSAGWHENSTLDLNGFSLHAGRTINFADGRRTGTIRNSSTTAATIAGTITTLAAAQQTGNRTLAFGGPGIIRHTGLLTGGTDAGAETIRVNDGGKLILDGDGSGYGGNFTVRSGGFIGGDGSLGTGLTLESGAGFLFDPDSTLTVAGTTVVNNLGIGNLLSAEGTAIDWSSISNGTYELISGTITGSLLHDSSNPFNLGDGRQAYFRFNSLELVVIPEPSSYAMIGGLMAFLWLMLMRRRK